MTVDVDVVRRRCGEIAESLERLRQIGDGGRETFLADRDTRDIACYRLLLAIEAALALCYHVSARHLRQVPEDYADCFAGLARAGVIPHVLSDRLQQMARFRNLLVHVYWEVDYGRVFDAIETELDDLTEFSSAIASLV
jgi:uncharacterized protein YutE (UPF0331/DUF86 family)